jgi:uncharacterized protein (TIGR03067 family)
MRTMLVGVAAGLLIAMAAVADEGKGDQDKLQGAWKAEKAEQNGKGQSDADEHTLTFAGDTFTITRKDQVILKGTFTVDAAKKPKQIDLAVKESRGGKDDGKTAKGIYELDGDTLKWCTAGPGTDDRPGEFATAEGNDRLFVTLKRQKK